MPFIESETARVQKKLRFPAIAFASTTLICLMLPALPASALDLQTANEQASAASAAYDDAVAARDAVAAQLEDAAAREASAQEALSEARRRFDSSVVSAYKSGGTHERIASAVLVGRSIEEIVSSVEAIAKISEEQAESAEALETSASELAARKAELENAKAEADTAVSEAESAKQAALDAQEEARAAWSEANANASSVSSTRRAPTSTVAYDEETARAWIVNKESGGNYNARNGRYIGAYQLTDSYLNGDYSPENQDRVAEQYVKNRYGSWMGAVEFWQTHGWY